MAAGSAHAQEQLGESKTPTNSAAEMNGLLVQVRPLVTRPGDGREHGQEGVGFTVALTIAQDDMGIFLDPPAGKSIINPEAHDETGKTAWHKSGYSNPNFPNRLAFEVYGADPGDNHSVDLWGGLEEAGSGKGESNGRERFNTAAADIQMDVFGGSWGQFFGGSRLSPSEGGGEMVPKSVSGAFPPSVVSKNGNYQDGNGNPLTPTMMSLNLSLGLPREFDPASVVGQLTFSFKGDGAQNVAIYDLPANATTSRPVYVPGVSTSGISVLGKGFSGETFLILANQAFDHADTLTATFTWAERLRPAISEEKTGRESMFRIMPSSRPDYTVVPPGTPGNSTTYYLHKPVELSSPTAYSAKDFVGVNPGPTIIGPRNIPGPASTNTASATQPPSRLGASRRGKRRSKVPVRARTSSYPLQIPRKLSS